MEENQALTKERGAGSYLLPVEGGEFYEQCAQALPLPFLWKPALASSQEIIFKSSYFAQVSGRRVFGLKDYDFIRLSPKFSLILSIE